MKKNKEDRIAIIGAGPAGLYATWLLEKAGYDKITIFEKDNRVGGKCCSPSFKGKHFEMGAVLGVPSYPVTNALMAELGVKTDGPKLVAGFCTSEGKSFAPFDEAGHTAFMAQMQKLKELLETQYDGYDCCGHLNTHPDLMMSFMDFCEMKGLPLIPKAYIGPCTSFGYGYFNLVPAIYYMKYLGWERAGQFLTGNTYTWENGSESIWETLRGALKNQPRLCADIRKVVRKDRKVYVYSDLGKEVFDDIIVTSPLDQMENYFDVTEDEQLYFSKIIHSDYRVFAFTVKNYPQTSLYVPQNMMQSRAGHVMLVYDRWKDDHDQVVTAYIYGDDSQKVDMADIYRWADEDMKKFGCEIDQLIQYRSWYYFPHINCTEYQSGWYDKVESWQGQRGTYYAGEIMNFGDIEETLEYTQSLIERFF